jgi:hypothetical protein
MTLLDDPNPMARLGAAKEIISRVAPPPPRRKAETNIAVQVNNISDDQRSLTVARAKMRAASLDPNAFLPRPGAQSLIPADRIHDTVAHWRRVMDASLAGAWTRSVQALQQASTMSS